jgi:tight adherence protein B
VSTAALVLAMALLTMPTAAHHRVSALSLASPVQRRLPVVLGTAVAASALTIVLPPGAIVAVAIMAATVAVRLRRRTARKRRGAECCALQGALEVLVGELRVGAHPVAAFDVAAAEVDGTVARSLRAVAARARLGADVAAGLRMVARQSPLRSHWERLAVCWHLAEAHGLAIAKLMQTAQGDIVERERFSARINAAMAGARTTAAVLAGLPVLGIGLGQLIGADPLTFLLSGGVGGWLLVVGVTLACVGLVWSDHIIGQAVK